MTFNLDVLVDSESTAHIKKPARTDYYRAPLVHKYDQYAFSVVPANLKKGPWIAGGAALAWFQNRPVDRSDIDIFCRDEEQRQKVIRLIQRESINTVYRSTFADTFELIQDDKTHTLQVIKRDFGSVDQLINSFDVSVCKIATDGQAFHMAPGTAYDINHKILRMDLPLRQDTVKRLVKYWCYGYTPTEELLAQVYSDPILNWHFANITGEYNNAF